MPGEDSEEDGRFGGWILRTGERVSASEAVAYSRGKRRLCKACASTTAWGSLIRYCMERAPACTAEPARGWALAGAHCLPDTVFTESVSLVFKDGSFIYVVY